MRGLSRSIHTQNEPVNGAARRSNPRPPESLPQFPSLRGDAVAASPAFPQLTGYRHLERARLRRYGSVFSVWCFVAVATLSAAVHEVDSFGMTVGNLDTQLQFYTNVLTFEKVSESPGVFGADDELLGLTGTRARRAELRLGDERIVLTEHLESPGRPIPLDSRSQDHWFQHIAIVVSDMDAAYAWLRQHKVRHVSTGPQTLPAWNPEAGGIKAFYFRDPEDHVLEIIWFPPGKGDPKWQPTSIRSAGKGPLFLGIDHTAIVVADTDRSLEFYRDVLGLRVAGTAENHGVEQEHLNQVFGARVRITSLRAEHGPGVEFLEYLAPPGGRPMPVDAGSNDLIFWTTRLVTGDLPKVKSDLQNAGAHWISRRETVGSWIVRDPDGHAIQLKGFRARPDELSQ